jgi:hypothetical protein
LEREEVEKGASESQTTSVDSAEILETHLMLAQARLTSPDLLAHLATPARRRRSGGRKRLRRGWSERADGEHRQLLGEECSVWRGERTEGSRYESHGSMGPIDAERAGDRDAYKRCSLSWRSWAQSRGVSGAAVPAASATGEEDEIVSVDRR